MKSLKTTYMGLEIENPIIIGASNISSDPDLLKKAEDQGAGAIVYKSLFEEQIQLERLQLDEKLTEYDDLNAEMLTTHPKIEYDGPEEHLSDIRRARESISIPLIASLNAVNNHTWIKYASLLCQTGVAGIELNFYSIPSDFSKESKDIEDEQIHIVNEIRKHVTIPVGVKLSGEYTNILNFIRKLDQCGVNSFTLFNSFFQPDIDILTERHIKSFNLSNEGDYGSALRFAGLLFGNINADICSSHGVFSGTDAIRLILAGASSVQVVSSLYKNGLQRISEMKKEILDWMEMKSYNRIDEFRGRLSRNKLSGNPFVYKRAQYADLLINSDKIFGIPR